MMWNLYLASLIGASDREVNVIKVSPWKFFLPNLESIQADVVLDVFEGSPESRHGFGQGGQLGRKFICLQSNEKR